MTTILSKLSELVRGLLADSFTPGETIVVDGIQILMISESELQIIVGSQPAERWVIPARA